MRSETVAVRCQGLPIGVLEPFLGPSHCDRLPPVAPAGLHRRSIPVALATTPATKLRRVTFSAGRTGFIRMPVLCGAHEDIAERHAPRATDVEFDHVSDFRWLDVRRGRRPFATRLPSACGDAVDQLESTALEREYSRSSNA
jgi:hypothetical protein